MKLLTELLRTMFGCPHPRYSFPVTVTEGKQKHTTVFCPDCYTKLPYDPERMERAA